MTRKDDECPGCGSTLANREARAKRDKDDAIPTSLTECPYCGTLKCCMCDMGDDVECISCNQDED